MTTEYPIFVPLGNEHLAAVVTVPDGPAKALTLMLQGLGATRSHRYGLWTRTARLLAERGIASVRLDYPEMGDSTGVMSSTLTDPPVAEAEAVQALVRSTLGVEQLLIIGNCLGARTGLRLAIQIPSCSHVACLVPTTPGAFLVNRGKSRPHRAAHRWAQRLPSLARRVRVLVRSERIQPQMRIVPEVAAALRTRHVTFHFIGMAGAAQRFEAALRRLSDRGPDEHLEIRHIPTDANTHGMRIPLPLQPVVIDALVDWVDGALASNGQSE